MGKNRRKKRSEANEKEAEGGSVLDVPVGEKIDRTSVSFICSHIKNSVDSSAVIKLLRIKAGVCDICLKHGTPAPSDLEPEGPWICLKCGQKSCTLEHSQKHNDIPRSDSHSLSVNLSNNTVWCHGCNGQIPPFGNNKKLQSCLTDLERVLQSQKAKEQNISTKQINLSAEPVLVPNSQTSDTFQKGKFGEPKSSLSSTVVGMINAGNTCYANSVLQCLTQTPKLEESIKNEFTGPVSIHLKDGQVFEYNICKCDNLIQEYLDLHNALANQGQTNDKLKVMTAVAILRELSCRHPHFKWAEQHDAHEFLRLLLDSLRTSIQQSYKTEILKQKNLETAEQRKAASNEVKKELKELNQKICDVKDFGPENVFSGQLVSRLKCEECGSESECMERFMDLSLPVITDEPVLTALRKKGGQSAVTSFGKPRTKRKHANERKYGNENYWRKENNCQKYDDENNWLKQNNCQSVTNQKDDFSDEDNKATKQHVGGKFLKNPVKSDRLNMKNDVDWSKSSHENSPVKHGEISEGSPSTTILENDETNCVQIDNGIESKAETVINEILDESNFLSRVSSQEIESDNSNTELGVKDNNSLEPIVSEIDLKDDISMELHKMHISDQLPGSFDDQIDDFSNLDDENCKISDSLPPQETIDNARGDLSTGDQYFWMRWTSNKILNDNSWLYSSNDYGDVGDKCSKMNNPFIFCKDKNCPFFSEDLILPLDPNGGLNISRMLLGGEEERSIIELTPAVNVENFSDDILRLTVDRYFEMLPEGIACGTKKLLCSDLAMDSEETTYDPQLCRQQYPPSNVPLTEETNSPCLQPSKNINSDDQEIESFFNQDKSSEENTSVVREEVKTVENGINPSSDSDDGLGISNLYDIEEEDDIKVSSGVSNLYDDEEENHMRESPYISSNNSASAKSTIESCLQEFLHEEVLTGSNKVGCGVCTARANKGKAESKTVYTTCTKQLMIRTVPEAIILHLKRFQVQMSSLRKVDRHVSFPLVLNITPFCKAVKGNETVNGETSPEFLYLLYGIVEHSGTINGGHYVAYVARFEKETNSDDSNTEGKDCPVKIPKVQWFLVNDRQVTAVTEARVLAAQAYLLFYRRLQS